MAKDRTSEEIATENEIKKLKDEKQQLKKDQKAQKKEAKRRAKEIAKQEEELEGESNGLVTFLATIVIVALWIAVICIVVKMDVGGFGSTVLAPVLGDVPVVNKILPAGSVTQTASPGSYGGYSSLQDAVDQIRSLELQLEQARNDSAAKDERLTLLQEEVARLKEFENMQVEFDRIRNEFYEEVIYAEKGPGPEEYQKYYETMNPTMAEYVYRQVVSDLQESAEIQDYASSFSSMDAASAAKIMEQMPNDLKLCARILRVLGAEQRGKILAAMSPEFAAKVVKIMDPQS
ncbi:MAG: hypothetical protein J1E64_13630 [Acetatifactor sp.]|nr:hypothetical protein [Acetatifactor sp.]